MVHISCLRIIETTLAPIRWNDKTIETVIPFYKKKNFIYKKSKAVLKLAKLEKIGSNGFTSLMANLCHKKGACALIEHFLRGEYFSLGCDNHHGKVLKFGKFAEKF